MTKLRILAVVSASLFTVSVLSMEVSSDAIESIQTIQTAQEYSGNAKIVFMPGEKFEISSDKTSKINSLTVFSGNVVVTFQGTTLRTDSLTVKRQADGTALLEADKFLVEQRAEK